MAAAGNNRKRRRDDITDQQIADYLTNRAFKLATKLKSTHQNRGSAGYSNNVNPFNDSNLNQLFVWPKKIKHDIAASRGGDGVSIQSMKKRQAELMAELQELQKTRAEKAIQKALREEDNAVLARKRARAEFHHLEKEEEEFVANQIKLRSEIRKLREGELTSVSEQVHKDAKTTTAMCIVEDGEQILGLAAEVSVCTRASQHCSQLSRKPEYFNRVHTGYEWNRYNRTHFDHENPPPKFVKGYKFTIFYPDLIDTTKPPVYAIEKDGDEADTCILRFSAGPPYADIAFRVVEKEWERSAKKGFKSTFDGKVMHLFFNFKRCPYRR